MHSNIKRPEKPQKTAKGCHSRAFSLLKKKKYNVVKVCVKDTFINVQKDYNKVQTTGYTQQQDGQTLHHMCNVMACVCGCQ